KATEEMLAASGLPYTLLRNGWYIENYTRQLDQYLGRGEILGAAGNGRVSAATRADYAAAAVAALLQDGSGDTVYELGGPAFDYAELAAAITEATGKPVAYRDVTADELTATLTAAGLDAGLVGFLVAVDSAIAAGHLETD